jgi:hypothetical protein
MYDSMFDLLESHFAFQMRLPVCLKIKKNKKIYSQSLESSTRL